MSFTAEMYPHIKRNTKILLQFRPNKTRVSKGMTRHSFMALFQAMGTLLSSHLGCKASEQEHVSFASCTLEHLKLSLP